jgi:hypothetical protein
VRLRPEPGPHITRDIAWRGRLCRASVFLLLALMSAVSTASAVGTSAEALMPPEQYTTTKGRALAARYRPQMVDLFDFLFHCTPWVDVQRASLGFRTPRGSQADDRFLSVWIWIDQHDDGPLAKIPQEQRASAMFSRYGVFLLHRMAAIPGLDADPDVSGYSVVLSWIRPDSRGSKASPEVNETIVMFVDKATARDYLAKQLPPADFVSRSKLVLFNGTAEIGRIGLEVWDDPFAQTFKPANYKPAKGKGC